MTRRTGALWLAVGMSLGLGACECGIPPLVGGGAGGGGGSQTQDAGTFDGGGGRGGAGGGAGGDDGGGGGQGGQGGVGGSGGDAGVTVDVYNPSNPTLDSDCDGLTDAEEFSTTYSGGAKTNPANPDTDGDGVRDGVEVGRTTSVDAACGFVGDADPSLRTVPTLSDSDFDALPDGIEDADKNGRIDMGETNPANSDSDFDALPDGAEDANKNGAVDTGETDPRKKDTDGDFINDGIEINLTKTDPLKPDTDGDSCLDSAEDLNQNGTVELGESNPKTAGDCGPMNNLDLDNDGQPNTVEDANGNGMVDVGETDPKNPDTDGDGLKDGAEDKNHNRAVDPGETNPLRKDTDCDGLLDGPTKMALLGEDQNANGAVDTGETDPTKRDTDSDGITDGVERGVTLANVPDVPNCGSIPVDASPTPNTDPTKRDSDGDGIDDGAEDINQNGAVDVGELDPSNGTDGVGPAGDVCTAPKLKPVLFRTELAPDLQLGLPASFSETATMTVATEAKGLIGYDAASKVAFIAWRQAAPMGSTTPVEDEVALQAALGAIGAISNETAQTYTSWDGIAALEATYDMAGSGVDLKARANAIAVALVGAGAGALTGAAGVTGDFKIQMEVLHRTNGAVVVLIALAPKSVLASDAGERALFSMSDTAGGSALAQFGDANAVQCERFSPTNGQVDFLFVVDDSCSMGPSQASLGAAATAMANALNNSSLDYRLAMVTSGYMPPYLDGGNRSVVRGFTRDVNQFRAWLTQNSTCQVDGGTCSLIAPAAACDSNGPGPQGRHGGCWIGVGGVGNVGAEAVLGSGRKALDAIAPTPDAGAERVDQVRPNAQVVVVLMGDADDQTTGYSTSSLTVSAHEPVANFIAFFNATGNFDAGTRNRLGQRIPVHGIVCPADAGPCNGEWQGSPQRHAQVIVATGGLRGSIRDSVSVATTLDAIVQSSISAAGYKMKKPPIGASVKVAMSAVQDGAQCNKSDIPRSRVNGFDFNGVTGTLSFYGACRPTAMSQAAVSYRYWIDSTPNAGGNPPPCSTDVPFFDPTQADFCRGRLVCNLQSNVCECPQGCGGTAPVNKVCNQNKQVCDFVCTSDCGGSCSGYQECNTTSCGCECKQTSTCAPGFVFMNGGSLCGCYCDTQALGCGANYQPNANQCACVCKQDCGGCGADQICNSSTCACQYTGPT